MANAGGVGAWRDGNFGKIGGQMKRSLFALMIVAALVAPLLARLFRDRLTSAAYVVVLNKQDPSPLLPESDDEQEGAADKSVDKPADKDADKEKKDESKEEISHFQVAIGASA